MRGAWLAIRRAIWASVVFMDAKVLVRSLLAGGAWLAPCFVVHSTMRYIRSN